MRILMFIGTRPEAIKMLPLAKELRLEKGIELSICYSGQHGALASEVFDFFKIAPNFEFDALVKGQSLNQLICRLLDYFDVVLKKSNPDLVLVHGDTATAFAASLSAFHLGIKTGHIEAGLRTFDMSSPYPEEFYRVAIDAMSSLHFAPTELSAKNLKKEGRNGIFTVGNTVIDAFSYTLKNDYKSSILSDADGRKIILLTTHRRENLGEKMRNSLMGLRDVLDACSDLFCIWPAHPNPEVRKMAFDMFCNVKNIKIFEPISVFDFHNILWRSHFVVTDSGGIQEEASYLGIPTFLIRDTTERAEGVKSGNIRVLGTSREGIRDGILSVIRDKDEFQKMRIPSLVFGDGNASKKIAKILLSMA